MGFEFPGSDRVRNVSPGHGIPFPLDDGPIGPIRPPVKEKKVGLDPSILVPTSILARTAIVLAGSAISQSSEPPIPPWTRDRSDRTVPPPMPEINDLIPTNSDSDGDEEDLNVEEDGVPECSL